MGPRDTLSCTVLWRHSEFWRRSEWSNYWVCWFCHPSPYPLSCRLDTRAPGFWGRDQYSNVTWHDYEWDVREPEAARFPSDPRPTVAPSDQGRGRRAAQEAIGRVERNAPPTWVDRALKAVEHVATLRDEFTTDAIWHLVGAPPEPRAMGAVMQRAAKLGLAEATDRTVESKRPECHARPIRVWKSLVP